MKDELHCSEKRNYYSKYFIAPHSSGNLSITNPNENAATGDMEEWRISVPANQTSVVPWPPSNIDSAANVEQRNILVEWELEIWHANACSTDTGQVTGWISPKTILKQQSTIHLNLETMNPNSHSMVIQE